MVNRILVFLIFQFIIKAYKLSSHNSKRRTIDKIVAIIYHTEGKSIILQSDLKPGLDGISKPLEQLINERLILMEAKKLKVEVDEDQVNRYLAQIQKHNNLTQDDIKRIFKEAGFSYKEGIENLRIIQTIELMLENRVKSKVFIDKKEIEEYYKNNPLYEEGKYKVSQLFIPFEGGSKTLKRIKIQKDIESKKIAEDKNWTEPILFTDKDFSEDKKYIMDLEKGDITISNESDRGFHLIQMVDKSERRLVSLESRYKEISNIIGKEKYDKALESYYKSLRKSAIIKYIN
jgi:parvulin-like peptidyl-prolyl isomerase